MVEEREKEELRKEFAEKLKEVEELEVGKEEKIKDIFSLFEEYKEKLENIVKEIEKEKKELGFEKVAEIILKNLGKGGEILKNLSPQKIVANIIRAYQMFLYSESVDEFGYDPKFEEFIKPIFDFLYKKWWRVDVEGIENVPKKGRVLLVANHSGMLPMDGAMIKYALYINGRDARPLAENFVYYLPFVGTIMNRVGGVRASPENAEILLERDEAVLVFPEGVKGITKHFKKRYQLQRFGRGGFIKLAIRTRSPIVPIAVVGAEEIYPIIAKIDWLGRIFNLPTLPIPINLILGPLGIIPFPTKWYIKFGEVINATEYPPSAAEDDILVNQLTQYVRQKIQDMIDELLKRRKSIWK